MAQSLRRNEKKKKESIDWNFPLNLAGKGRQRGEKFFLVD